MTTKAERKAQRAQNRELRKKLKKDKKAMFNEILAAAGRSDISVDLDADEPGFAEVFNQVWPIMKPVLGYAELVRITGPEADKVIHTLIDLGERISTGKASEDEQTAFIGALDTIWDPLKTVLGIIVTFTDDKADAIINKVVEIGDWITDDDSN